MHTISWEIAVSPDMDQSVQAHLAEQARAGVETNLSEFVENAVRSWLFEHTVEQAKLATAPVGELALDEIINEAVTWARAH